MPRVSLTVRMLDEIDRALELSQEARDGGPRRRGRGAEVSARARARRWVAQERERRVALKVRALSGPAPLSEAERLKRRSRLLNLLPAP